MTTEGTIGAAPLPAPPGRAPARRAAVHPPRGPRPGPPPRRGPRARRRPGARGGPVPLLVADAGAVAVLAAAAPAVAPAAPAVFVLLAGLGGTAGLYRPAPADTALDELPRLLGHIALAWGAAQLLSGAAGSTAALLPLVAAHTVLAAAARALAHHARRRAARARPGATLVVGTAPAAQRVVAVLARHPEYGMRPVGMVGPVPRRLPATAPLPVLTSTREVRRAIVRDGVTDAVFTRAPQDALLRLFRAHGCAVWLVAAEPSAVRAGPVRGHLWGFACLRLGPPPGRRAARLAKRGLDIAVACAALLAAAPLLALCALAVRLSEGPGVLFRQTRVGEDGRPFAMLKFRTLRPADEREAATRWTVAGDPRLTPVGRLLRRTSLDELPQLWNVLRGDMSLVGPRPERPHFVERFSRLYPGYADRHRMPAGLTGLAQVSGLRGDTSIEDRARFDNLYIETWSLWQDVRIMLRTTALCFRPGGR
ncbi:exopolysaccharide biosynthesis polyprenyl glycosylphosphotransferase [Streptomyces marincola]|uniref:exopolysaccharide biosynthesis polyprenyl glycosylphosphotransferase n=1 Tax=Streptomyces marincola TaxID=2878388 RepID=UPI001CF28697|nr:exopolysaccharide biosynthesis polyprenyl glycosylphosphotransferase [Streptomyces marincola]UCM89136.1 exopolysaccharide biosynthesis polyprenyl glycosylphosphotransferase [Streptomyces marincola]